MASSIGSLRRTTAGAVALVAACLAASLATCLAASGPAVAAAQEPPHSAELDAMIIKEAQRHGVPEHLVRRIVMRESRYNPRARNHKYWGLMQISYPTARSMGFKGTPEQLLNPLVNLTYAVPYLANAFVAAGKREDAAVRLYASGYYDTARHLGMLGSLRTADSAPVVGFHDDVQVAAAAPPSASSFGIFGAPIGPSEPASAAPPVAAAAPVPSAPAASAVAAASGPSHGGRGEGSADMVADKSGRAAPPKKWTHDGGVSVLARGEQGVEHVAAYSADQGKAAPHRTASRHSRKNTQFASLDAPASAQAYAASEGAPAAPPQAAIAQVMAAPGADSAAASQGAYAPAPAAAQEAASAAASAADGSEADRPARKKRHRVVQKSTAVAKGEAKTAKSRSADAKPTKAESAQSVAALRP